MSKFITSFICTAMFASAASVAQAESVEFSRDGYNYQAEVTQLPSGITRIAGRELVTGQTFRLYVRNARVNGVYGSTGVAFGTPEVEVTQLSSR